MSDDSMLTLEAIRDCLDGAIPSAVATCASDGTPNVTFVSQVHYVDGFHVALSFQFFSKTRENVLETRRAVALVNHPVTAAKYRLELEYLRTETEGPLFEKLKAKLGIASHTGMAGIFRLRGSDVYRVLGISAIRGKSWPFPHPSTICFPRSGCALSDSREAPTSGGCSTTHSVVWSRFSTSVIPWCSF